MYTDVPRAMKARAREDPDITMGDATADEDGAGNITALNDDTDMAEEDTSTSQFSGPQLFTNPTSLPSNVNDDYVWHEDDEEEIPQGVTEATAPNTDASVQPDEVTDLSEVAGILIGSVETITIDNMSNNDSSKISLNAWDLNREWLTWLNEPFLHEKTYELVCKISYRGFFFNFFYQPDLRLSISERRRTLQAVLLHPCEL